MNKKELVEKMAAKSGLKKTDADKALAAFMEAVVEEMKNGGSVQLVGFGTFEAVDRPERTCRNPLTGDMITVAASKSPKFKPGKGLKDKLNG